MNVCTMIGRLCGDPELKTTPGGLSVVSFSLAVERGYTDKGGERVADFIPCVAWRQTAELVARHFHKGQRMGLRGELQSRSYAAKDGSRRTVYEVVAERVYFCERQPAATGAVSGPDTEAEAPVVQDQSGVMDFVDEELPF